MAMERNLFLAHELLIDLDESTTKEKKAIVIKKMLDSFEEQIIRETKEKEVENLI